MSISDTKSAGLFGFWPNTYQRIQNIVDTAKKIFCANNDCPKTLPITFIHQARKYWFKKCIVDCTGQPLTYGKTLTSSIALSKKLKSISGDSENIGILLPPSVAGAITNFAVSLTGKVTVNLNYTVSEQARSSAIDQCDLDCIITSKLFVKKTDLDVPESAVYIEDIISQISIGDKLIALVKALLYPKTWLTGSGMKNTPENNPAAIIFSSGSTGNPKGVVLSHRNILSNVESLTDVLNVDHNDDLCAVLPLFHSFGYTCGLWLPIAVGASITFVVNPLDTRLVAAGVSIQKSTVLFAPPSILAKYVKRIVPEDFKTLRIVAAGAEKLTSQLSDAFYEHFNIRLYQGYGATELSPVAALYIPRSISKHDTVGRPLPGITIRVVDPDTGIQLPPDTEGLIEIKGPNVMVGYHNEPELTQKVINDGWYDTGDVGKIDSDGFLTITDRLTRFSKIAGEMVPHLAIEQVIHDGLNTHDQVAAVTGIPDDNKGEQLVVLFTDDAGTVSQLQQIVNSSSLPNIFRPKNNNYIKIEKLPFLGTGKLDIMKLRMIAMKQSQVCPNL